ncbi:MAG TPA: NnrS family protein, partial [Dongiaceae bacterium]
MTNAPSGIPRYRSTSAPALFREGFRPFFLLAAVWAVLSLAIWLAALQGRISLPSAFDPLSWHSHEMIYGFAVAAVAGFLLTSIPNWTGYLPLQGAPLVTLTAVWIAGRCAMATSAWIGALPASVVELAFLVLFLGAVAREVVAGRSWRNLPAVGALGLLLVGNCMTHLDAAGIAATGAMGNRLGLAVLAGLISLVGGRIIPSFTRNRLVKQKARRLPATAGWFDRLVVGLVPLALGAWVAGIAEAVTGLLLLAAGVAAGLRLARWRGIAIWRDPLLSALHLGYAWLALGIALLGASGIWTGVPESAALHALGAGAVSTMILAVMVRATLAHTGRPQVAGTGTGTLYLLAHAAALLRVGAACLPSSYPVLLPASGIAWIAAYSLFALIYGP